MTRDYLLKEYKYQSAKFSLIDDGHIKPTDTRFVALAYAKKLNLPGSITFQMKSSNRDNLYVIYGNDSTKNDMNVSFLIDLKTGDLIAFGYGRCEAFGRLSNGDIDIEFKLDADNCVCARYFMDREELKLAPISYTRYYEGKRLIILDDDGNKCYVDKDTYESLLPGTEYGVREESGLEKLYNVSTGKYDALYDKLNERLYKINECSVVNVVSIFNWACKETKDSKWHLYGKENPAWSEDEKIFRLDEGFNTCFTDPHNDKCLQMGNIGYYKIFVGSDQRPIREFICEEFAPASMWFTVCGMKAVALRTASGNIRTYVIDEDEGSKATEIMKGMTSFYIDKKRKNYMYKKAGRCYMIDNRFLPYEIIDAFNKGVDVIVFNDDGDALRYNQTEGMLTGYKG